MKSYLLLFILISIHPVFAAVIFGPIIYRQTSDGPFYSGIVSGDIQLENFEDQRLSIEGVTISTGRIERFQSIDGEDGVLDYFGNNYQWTTGGEATIFYPRNEENRYPSYVGLALLGYNAFPEPFEAWKYFQAFGPDSTPLFNRQEILMVHGTPGPFGNWAGGDQFIGVYAPEGISSIRVTARGFDHLQVGWAIPEPSSVALSGSALVILLRRRRRLR